MNLIDELATLIAELDRQDIPYALCGGLAMSIHAQPRATIDIDLLVPAAKLDEVKQVARERCDFSYEARPMTFADGAVPIHRLTKLPADSPVELPLDILVVTDATQRAWETRQEVQWERGRIWVVSRDGLIALKRLRGTGQDQDDIARLEKGTAD